MFAKNNCLLLETRLMGTLGMNLTRAGVFLYRFATVSDLFHIKYNNLNVSLKNIV